MECILQKIIQRLPAISQYRWSKSLLLLRRHKMYSVSAAEKWVLFKFAKNLKNEISTKRESKNDFDCLQQAKFGTKRAQGQSGHSIIRAKLDLTWHSFQKSYSIPKGISSFSSSAKKSSLCWQLLLEKNFRCDRLGWKRQALWTAATPRLLSKMDWVQQRATLLQRVLENFVYTFLKKLNS